MPQPDQSLELSPAEFEEMGHQVLRCLSVFLKSLPQQPAADLEGADERAEEFREDLPEAGTPLDSLLEAFFGRAVPKAYNCASPGYLAYVPGGGLPHAALADLMSDITNRYVNVWTAAPAMAQIESSVIGWFCDIVGYPQGAGGYLASGGSMANFSALAAARSDRLPENFLQGTLYASDQVHHCVHKAARMAGFPADNLRVVPSLPDFRIDTRALQRMIEEDAALGRTPFLVVGSAGTTNTGAVDDLQELARICRQHSLWLHVDAAYGGFFMLTERGRRRMKGLALADSIALDPHKGLFLPYGTGCLLARDPQALRKAHSERASYMPPMRDDLSQVDFCDVSPELSRGFRGLRVWLPLKMHGIGPFRRNLQEKLDLAEMAAQELATMKEIEVVAPPQLSLLAFRLKPHHLEDPQQLNQLNRQFLECINSQSRLVFLTGTTVGRRFLIRICVLCFRTHRETLDIALDDIRKALREVRSRILQS
ncbi:MAG TPA: aminotransferase class I/II-fold pyridoxal phosphate-dependent enzyme [Acidobacteriota bacterium]|nr:aminotransferase class I/II-fold pyridoxal phosphate-dependent enzyme [Acidobacteriota bacterium]